MNPLVTVVIPTRDRPVLVTRAIESALGQTIRDLEVIVIIDGVDPATATALRRIEDPRLRVHQLENNVRGAEARNIGARYARGEWIAFLDDDDEWLPSKIELQLREASSRTEEFTLISCRAIARTPRADYLWPRRLPAPGEATSDYLMLRRSFFRGEGSIQTSTFFCRTSHFLRHPFRRDLLKHQDTEWLLRTAQLPDFRIRFVDQALIIHHIEEERKTVSSKSDWRYSLNWARSERRLFTPHAYSAFLLHSVSAEAAEEHCWPATRVLLGDAFRYGHPTPTGLALFCSMWIFPRTLRRRLRDSVMHMAGLGISR
jgi:glycosyltransferase involved in cell wall biosynthesis